MASDKQIRQTAKTQSVVRVYVTGRPAKSSRRAQSTASIPKSEVMRAESRPDRSSHRRILRALPPTVPEERCLVDMLIKSNGTARRYMSNDAGIRNAASLDSQHDELSLGRFFERIGIRSSTGVGRPQSTTPSEFPERAEAAHGYPRQTSQRALPGNRRRSHPEPLEPAQILPSATVREAALETSGIATNHLTTIGFVPSKTKSEPETPPSAPTQHHQKTGG